MTRDELQRLLNPEVQALMEKFLERSGITAASIQRRDFPLSPDNIRRMYALKEGVGQLLCIYCEREA